MLLVTGARQGLRQAYRRPLDALEEWSTGQADLCLVNSRFTQGTLLRRSTCSRVEFTIVFGQDTASSLFGVGMKTDFKVAYSGQDIAASQRVVKCPHKIWLE